MTSETLSVLNQEQLVEKQTQLYCNKLVLAMKQWHADNGMPAKWETRYIYETGRKYFKVIRVEDEYKSNDEHRCVEAFIDRQTGDIFKPASWRKPAKGARFNLLDEQSCQLCFQHLDPFGGHLYANTKQNIYRGS